MENMQTDVEVLRVKFAWKLFVVGLKPEFQCKKFSLNLMVG